VDNTCVRTEGRLSVLYSIHVIEIFNQIHLNCDLNTSTIVLTKLQNIKINWKKFHTRRLCDPDVM